jgi:hypothetical protein
VHRAYEFMPVRQFEQPVPQVGAYHARILLEFLVARDVPAQ